MSGLGDRIRDLNWQDLHRQLDERGYAVTPRILKAGECRSLVALFDEDERYRSVIDMRRHQFGSGIYKYFDNPLPAPVRQLRQALYGPLAEIANEWAALLDTGASYPGALEEFLERCHERGQERPTPLIFRYDEGDFNALHQDVYGDVSFPFQAVTTLSGPDRDFTGGEFLLVTQRPRAQSIGEAISLDQGRFLIFPNQLRPAEGKRGHYRLNVRHGVSRVRSGTRHTLGIIFHDAR
jgi:hypothetical protein